MSEGKKRKKKSKFLEIKGLVEGERRHRERESPKRSDPQSWPGCAELNGSRCENDRAGSKSVSGSAKRR